MRKIILITTFICLAAAGGSAQKRPTPVKPKPAAVTKAAEISSADWQILTDALKAEDWEKSAEIAFRHLQTLKTDNDKKQLARLRYIYLFALTGKILNLNAQGNETEAEKTWLELDRSLRGFIGKEFILPARPFSPDCRNKINYVCRVKTDPNSLRVTATNSEGNAIHSFNYIVFDSPVNFPAAEETEVLVGGILQNAEYNDDASKPWAIRLFFKKGFLR